jgi:hypothetical protein
MTTAFPAGYCMTPVTTLLACVSQQHRPGTSGRMLCGVPPFDGHAGVVAKALTIDAVDLTGEAQSSRTSREPSHATHVSTFTPARHPDLR